MDFDASLLVIMVIFGATYLVVRRTLVGPIMGLLRDRDAEITTSREAFEQAQTEVEERIAEQRKQLALARSEAALHRDRLRKEAQQAREQLVAEARQEADAELQEAVAALDAEVAEQRRSLEERARRLGEEMAGKLMGAPS